MRPPIPDRFIPPALPPSYAPAPTPPWHPAPPPPPSSSHPGVFFFFVFSLVAFAVCLLLAFVSDRHSANRRRENRRRAEAAAAAAPPPRVLPRLEPTGHFEEQRRLRQARAPNPANRLPAFRYNRSVGQDVTAGGSEECPVCLGAFQLGETVRLLPLCLHLYHVECIDPWLDAHSTCPICRSGTHPTVDVARRPPV